MAGWKMLDIVLYSNQQICLDFMSVDWSLYELQVS